MKKLIFICRGNKLRSPIAEAIFNKDPVKGWKAFSYGTEVEKEGWQNMKLSQFGGDLQIALEEMGKLDMDISNKKCNQILPEYVEKANKVIVMAETKFVPDWLEKKNYERWEIHNPENISEFYDQDLISLLSEKVNELKKSLEKT